MPKTAQRNATNTAPALKTQGEYYMVDVVPELAWADIAVRETRPAFQRLLRCTEQSETDEARFIAEFFAGALANGAFNSLDPDRVSEALRKDFWKCFHFALSGDTQELFWLLKDGEKRARAVCARHGIQVGPHHA